MELIRDLDQDKLTPARLWTRLDLETRRQAARSLFDPEWDDDSARAEANHSIAQTLRFREAAVRRLAVDKRVNYLARMVRPSDGLAGSMLTALHLTQRRTMLAAFMDALGIPQTRGVIDPDHEVQLSDTTRLSAAVESLFADFADSEVEVYLASLIAMDPEVWGGLTLVLHERADEA